jgi:hypothetical protein
MGNAQKTPEDWTEPEQWTWEQITAGKPANFNTRGTDPKYLVE